MNVKPRKFLIIDIGKDAVVSKRIDFRKMQRYLIENAKSINLEKLEEEVERR